MNKIKEKYLISIFLTFLVFGVSFLVIFVLLSGILDYSNNFLELKTQFFELKNKSDLIEKEKNYQNIEDYWKNIYQLFSNKEKPVEEVFFLRKMTQKYNLSADINFEGVKNKEQNSWPHLYFKLELFGKISDFFMLLEEIEKNPKLIELERLTVSKNQRILKSEEGNIKATLYLKFYFLENE